MSKLTSRTIRPALRFLTSKIFFPRSQRTLGNFSLISRPTMLAMISSMLVSAKLTLVMNLPSRMIVTRSTMCCSSSSRWEM